MEEKICKSWGSIKKNKPKNLTSKNCSVTRAFRNTFIPLKVSQHKCLFTARKFEASSKASWSEVCKGIWHSLSRPQTYLQVKKHLCLSPHPPKQKIMTCLKATSKSTGFEFILNLLMLWHANDPDRSFLWKKSHWWPFSSFWLESDCEACD